MPHSRVLLSTVFDSTLNIRNLPNIPNISVAIVPQCGYNYCFDAKLNSNSKGMVNVL